MMKNLIFIISALMILLSCSKEPNPIVSVDGNEIRFDIADTKVESVSDIDEFGVFVEQNLGPDDTPMTHQWVSLLENERVYLTEDDYTYDQKRYWVEDRTFFFFGVYPYGTNVTRTAEDNSVSVDGNMMQQTTFGYTFDLSVPLAANTDYMVAQSTVVVPTGLAGFNPTVDMQFDHLLTKVAFSIKKSEGNKDDEFIVTQVGLLGISRNGTYTVTHAPNSYTTALTPAVENRLVRRSGLSATLTTDYKNVLGDDDGLLLMPQKFTDGQVKLSVQYTYKQKGTENLQYATLEVGIPAGEVNRWESGKAYTYNLEIMIDDKIYISTPSVSKWGTAQQGGTIIIK